MNVPRKLHCLWLFLLSWQAPGELQGESIDPFALLNPSDPTVAAWVGSAQIRKYDVWIATRRGPREGFGFRIGAGGDIGTLTAASLGNANILAPSFRGEVNDRVLQWSLWDLGSRNPASNNPDPRFNISQAGSYGNADPRKGVVALSPTASVTLLPENIQVDVYSLPQDQWFPENQHYFKAKVSCLTRYQMKSGALIVRNVLLLGDCSRNGIPAALNSFYLETQLPVNKKFFNTLAFELSPDGTAAHWFATDFNLPQNNIAMNANQTDGYAVAFQRPSLNAPVLGFIFGTNELTVVGPGEGLHLYRNQEWSDGWAMKSALRFFGQVRPGTVIDKTHVILARNRRDSQLSHDLDSWVSLIPGPTIYLTGASLPPELSEIAAKLSANLTTPGLRTDHLSRLVNRPL